jgi:hypothetical protein
MISHAANTKLSSWSICGGSLCGAQRAYYSHADLWFFSKSQDKFVDTGRDIQESQISMDCMTERRGLLIGRKAVFPASGSWSEHEMVSDGSLALWIFRQFAAKNLFMMQS